MIELTEQLLKDEPLKLAKGIVANPPKNASKGDATNSQVRKYYDDFLLLQKKANVKDMDEERFKKEILPLIKFSEAKMAYNVGREVLSKDFADAINKKIADVESRKDFDHFILFYQAIIAYTKYEKFEKDEEYRAQKYQPTQNYYNGGKK